MTKPIFLLLLVLLAAACQPQANVVLPAQATASTPVAALPVNVARQAQAPTPVPQAVIDAADAEYLLLANIYERVVPSVVNIDVTINAEDSLLLDSASGSGMVYDDQGHIVTNAHVVQEADSMLVTFHDGSVAEATLVGVDVYSDIAVIRVDVERERLAPVVFGNSNAVRVGERAVAIGNPFGLTSSMTVGIISALGRQLPSAELIGATGGGFSNPSIIQVDTDINPGNSGGPLLNSNGQVIGVNTAIRTETGVFQGVGFAVPAATVQRVVPDLIANGRVEYAWLGISSESVENGFSVAGLAEILDLPVTAGVLISTVSPNSPAAAAGLQGGTRQVLVRDRRICAGGDIIVAINGEYVRTMDELVAYLVANVRPGDSITLLVVRGGETFDVPVNMIARPNDPVTPQCPE
ncbi:MAG: trypsin-like peptidase domain-containing protein [Anaerolinea sp.]|nr:trypsin-like peptidase domain-containing protein [Anaerolinea sp.]